MMDQDLKTLQLFYAGVLADSVYHYHNAGILNLVTEKKVRQQELTAAPQLKQLGIEKPEELFEYFSRVFGCIQWETKTDENACTATGKHCFLCNIAKKKQTAQPCYIYCINPFKAMLKAMDPSYKLEVESTLWDGEECHFKMDSQAVVHS